MFGIIRPSPSPVESLEQERPPSKLLKDDSLSIYEVTMMKLKQGARQSLISEHSSSPMSQDAMDIESSVNVSQDVSANSGLSSEARSVVLDCSSDSSCASVLSCPSEEVKKSKSVSIQYLFSRYTSLRQKQGVSSCDGSSDSPTNVSGCSSDSESTGCSKHVE
ncbi:hypothetical protein vseg_010318 [Gypsophila vaccaria]